MDRGAWQATVHGVPKSWTWLSDFSFSQGLDAVCVKALQSCLTLCDPMDVSLPGSSVHGILQARILELVSVSYLGELPDPGIEPTSFASPALAGGVFTISHPGSLFSM